MVYCGKPSKGCGACRARKVKCDQATPSCQRCIKANRTCPGYRDQLSLLFRDQSSSVAKKAKSNKTNDSSPSAVTITTSPASDSWQDHANIPTDYGLIQINARNSPLGETYYSESYDNYDQFNDVENFSFLPAFTDRRQQAFCYCLNSFVWLNGSLLKGLDYDDDMLSTVPMSQKAMMKGILAVGMANLSRTGSRSQSMRIEAQQEYQKALKFTNMAISHPKQAREDATLTAILCMSLFEILTSKKPEKVDSFIQHTRGAVALLEMRGEKQVFQSQYLHMFEFMRSEIMVSCIMRYYPVPPTLLILSEKVSMLPNMAFSSKISHQISVLICRINELRIENRDEKNSMDFDSVIISRASALDSELEAMMNTMPPEYTPEVHTLGPGQYFEHPTLPVRLAPLYGVYHKYQSFFHCSLQNIYRYGRIYAIELILNRLERMTLQPNFITTPKFKETCYRFCNLSQQQALDICATTPFLCGFLGDQQKTGKSPFLTNPAGGLASLFPLWTAASVDGYGSATCCWIEKTLEMIGREMGIDQALAMRQLTFHETGMTRFVDRL